MLRGPEQLRVTYSTVRPHEVLVWNGRADGDSRIAHQRQQTFLSGDFANFYPRDNRVASGNQHPKRLVVPLTDVSPPGIVKSASEVGTVAFLIGRSCFPISRLFFRLGFHQNAITAMSLAAAIIGSLLLVGTQSTFGFAACWMTSVALDFSDGQVARLRKTSNSSALHLDHVVDLIKISIISMALGVYFAETAAWLILTFGLSAFLLHVNLNSQLSASLKKGSLAQTEDGSRNGNHFARRFRQQIVTNFLAVTSTTILLLALAPFGNEFLILTYGYLGIVSSLMLTRSALKLRKLPRA